MATAVGLCAVLAARRLGAENIIAVGRHSDRLKVAESFGATHVVTDSGQDIAGELLEMTNGGAQSVCECVETEDAIGLSIAVARPAGSIGLVGMPQSRNSVDVGRLFNNIALNFGAVDKR